MQHVMKDDQNRFIYSILKMISQLKNRQPQQRSFQVFIEELNRNSSIKLYTDNIIVDYLVDYFNSRKIRQKMEGMNIYRKIIKIFRENNFITEQKKKELLRRIQKNKNSIEWIVQALLDSKQLELKQLNENIKNYGYDNFEKFISKILTQFKNLSQDQLKKIKQLFSNQIFKINILQSEIIYQLSTKLIHSQEELDSQLRNYFRQQLSQKKKIPKEYTLLKEFFKKNTYGIQSNTNIQIKGIAIFGSLANGFSTKNSDLDVTILTNSFVQEIQLLQYLMPHLENQFLDYKFQLIKSARVPVIKMKHKLKQTDVDIIVNNVLGILNSKLLRVYSQICQDIRLLGIMIKQWAKANGLIGMDKLSSYSFNLMMLHYLIIENYIVSIQKLNKKEWFLKVKNIRRKQIETYTTNVFFEHDQNVIKEQIIKQKKRIVKNDNQFGFNLFEVFLNFLKYYYQMLKEKKNQNMTISIKQKYKNFNDQKTIFKIEDPFQIQYNPGRWKNTTENVNKCIQTLEKTITNLESSKNNGNLQIQKIFQSAF